MPHGPRSGAAVTDFWKFNDLAEPKWLNGSIFGRVHFEREMRSQAVVIIEIACEDSLQISFIEHDDVIQALPANRSDDTLCVGVLLGTPGGNQHFFYPHVPRPLLEVIPIYLVAISKEILGCSVIWKCLHDLLRRPFGRWMPGHIEMDDSAPMMGEHDQYEEHLEPDRWYDKEIDGHEISHMVFQKCLPGRRGWMAWEHAVLVHS